MPGPTVLKSVSLCIPPITFIFIVSSKENYTEVAERKLLNLVYPLVGTKGDRRPSKEQILQPLKNPPPV